MSDALRMWIEVVFNVSYLIVVWTMVAVMVRRMDRVAPAQRELAMRVMQAFALLALGDTGHVGFRVVAYATSGLTTSVELFGMRPTLVGLGALATATTVTIFYVLMLEAWRLRFQRQFGWFEFALIGAASVRLAMMTLPINDWGAVEPPQPWGIYRNLPLMLQGLGLAYLVLRDATAAQDRTFSGIGVAILVSYACYIPVILFAAQIPLLGMLMIPKTLAYLVIGWLAFRELYGGAPQMRAAIA